MKIDDVKYKAQTGDLLTTVSSIWVRILTAESFSHSAIVLLEDNEIYVVEVHEDTGYTTKTEFEEWCKEYETVYLGIPEDCVRANREQVAIEIYKYLKRPEKSLKYGYWTLPLVWLSQLTKKRYTHKLNVCSTMVASIWRKVGWTNNNSLADPGDLARSCITLYRIET